jgi:hypothetical protein
MDSNINICLTEVKRNAMDGAGGKRGRGGIFKRTALDMDGRTDGNRPIPLLGQI